MKYLRVESPGGHFLLNIESISEVHTHEKDSIGVFTYIEEPLIIPDCSLITFERILNEAINSMSAINIMRQCREVVLGDILKGGSWYLDEKEALLDVITEDCHDSIIFYNDKSSTLYNSEISTRLSWRLV